jgi:cysteine desulfurase
VQAVGKIPVDVNALGVDVLSLSAHKLYGPKGVGALYVRRGTRLAPLFGGGHQEGRRRAGTENVAGIVGLGQACVVAAARLGEDIRHCAALRDELESALLAGVENALVHASAAPRLPGTSSMGFCGVEGEALQIALDVRGVAVSTGAACSSSSGKASPVLAALGVPPALARGTIRFSVGRGSSREEIRRTASVVVETVARLRAAARS